jgi:hypothetical protein
VQNETRNVAMFLILLVVGLFGAALISNSKQRAALLGMASLGLGITNTLVRIGEKRRTAR